jgi:molecular chaperone GrpE
MSETPTAPKGFTVVDRRASSMDEAAISEISEPTAAAKPAYVAQLEQALAEKERRLRELSGEVGAVQERARREAARETERNRRALLVELLDVLDGLERALGASGTQAATGGAGVAEGVALVRDLLVQKLAAFGVARIEARGARFDPARHEAQALVAVDDAARDGVVVDVFREGYAIGADVIRPAGVAVGRAR